MEMLVSVHKLLLLFNLYTKFTLNLA